VPNAPYPKKNAFSAAARRDSGRSAKDNISLDAGTLEALDEAAHERGLSRSVFIASAAREKIERGTFSNVIRFRGRSRPPPEPTIEGLVRELTMVEIELTRARIKQIRFETRQADVYWTWYCLKRVLFWGVVLWLLATLMASAKADPLARSRTFYDGRGSFAGSSVTRGNSSSFYDGRGSFAGSSAQHGKWTNFYDRQGRYSGSVIDTSPRR
jgi:Ribbon-helix-helix protein, copG family